MVFPLLRRVNGIPLRRARLIMFRFVQWTISHVVSNRRTVRSSIITSRNCNARPSSRTINSSEIRMHLLYISRTGSLGIASSKKMSVSAVYFTVSAGVYSAMMRRSGSPFTTAGPLLTTAPGDATRPSTSSATTKSETRTINLLNRITFPGRSPPPQNYMSPRFFS